MKFQWRREVGKECLNQYFEYKRQGRNPKSKNETCLYLSLLLVIKLGDMRCFQKLNTVYTNCKYKMFSEKNIHLKISLTSKTVFVLSMISVFLFQNKLPRGIYTKVIPII